MELAVQRLVKTFCKDHPELEDAEDYAEKDFRSLIQFHRYGDGYELAKALDGEGWEIDFELCEWLEDRFSAIIYAAVKEHVAEWAKSQSFPHAIGEAVQFVRAGKSEHGEIVALHPADAKATIYCPHLGHVRKGVGTFGFIIPWEDITPRDGGAA